MRERRLSTAFLTFSGLSEINHTETRMGNIRVTPILQETE